MSSNPQEEPFSEAHLDSLEYRERLMRKLNCLIAVLEVATAKVKKSLTGNGADVERLTRIRTNLQSTLDVCLRARAALERREALPKDLPENLAAVVRDPIPVQHASLPPLEKKRRAAFLETANESEREKFERLGPIDPRQLKAVDLEDLMRKLQA
jgi:hypothetical protein